ncbi:ABC-type multidrug transport system, ATPase and permease component [Hoeflea phototrophica DFL-43]|uniref:ABC-type multidrug transport system, ATPase and permease component n=1 Tax=Hoeflea phototrophica (strain DSM 17068 / NCIMB 14078 / DFL-43) TaxID=411684 RepID=A9DHA6_HOEPD|nr:ABC transporter ATP-binding protein [Hoeflea phototrophica]EDQ31509.1 ABC-type multidrug transport system, ATPase and permease component [Hoeflea phototrophica DFL-43]
MFGWFERRLNPYPETRPTAPPEGLVAFCWHYSREAGPWLIAMSVLTALISIGEVLLFGFLGSIVDWLANSDPQGFLDRESGRLFWMGGLVLIGLPLTVLIHSLIVHQTLLGNYPMIARWQMHRYLLRQSLSFFSDEFAGRVATKVMQTSLSIREAVMKILDVFVYVSVYFIAMIGMVASADWRLVLPLLFWLVVYIGLITYFVPRMKRISADQADARSAMTGRVVDSYTNISTVKLFSHAGREEAYARESMDMFLETVHRQMRLVTMFQSLIYFNNSVLVFVVSVMSIGFWLTGIVSVGSIAIVIGLSLRINGMSQWIMWEVSGFFENIGVVQDGMGMMIKPHDVVDRPGAGDIVAKKGAIGFDNVRFHYGKQSGVIENLSLDIKPGEKIGLVGRSGAGKTTLVNLLLRFYNLESGRVLIDGQDISQVSQDSLRAQVGMVSQDTSLLHRSVRDNIAYGRPDATEDEIIEAARKANALDFIAGLEDLAGRTGFDAHVGERGVKLSGGQRQRIAIARVFLKDAPILVLDEATSALDSEVESAIQENLFALMENKTVIAIAHRLSTIAQMDRLVVLDQGEIVETGVHDELITSGGIYADLWSRQSGGFIDAAVENAAE